MVRTAAALFLVIFFVISLGAQTKPAFEVASIRPVSQVDDQSVTLGIRIDGAQVRGRMALKDYIGLAYQLKTYQVSGPDWLDSARFDIAATIPAGVSTQQIPAMFQQLLIERFQLKTRREKKDFPVYALVVAKGGMRIIQDASEPDSGNPGQQEPLEATGTGSGQGVSVNLGRGAWYTFGNNHFEGKKLTMAQFAASLDRYLDRPVVDLTNLTARYDFAFDITEEDYRNMLVRAAVSSGISLPPAALRLLDSGTPVSFFDALEKLGLKLDSRKAPLDLLVIEEIRKNPTEN